MSNATPLRQGILETELRATIKRHALVAALIDANATLYTRNRELQDEADERRERLARIGGCQ